MSEDPLDYRFADDYDPRIVDLYDEDNPDGPDHDFYRALAERANATEILDVGCGTGILTVTFAESGRKVVGLDPSNTMLDYARKRSGAENVTWMHGDTRVLREGGFDFAVMSGNVAQHIPDPSWQRTLHDIRRVSRTGATLTFESRNPAARAWLTWQEENGVVSTRETGHGPLEGWWEVSARGEDEVVIRFYNHFVASGDRLVGEESLTFRSAETISDQLRKADFAVRAVWGDWQETPFDGTQPVMVFEAVAV